MMTKIRVFGPFHTGTNLIHTIINEAGCIVNGKPITANQNDKHDLNPQFSEDEFVILMYKNVFNWIYSINKEPYDMTFNELTSQISFREETFQNIIHLYNSYYLSYMDLLTSQNKNIIFLDYGKIIDKDSGFDYINGKLGTMGLNIQNREKFSEILGKPSKSHGFSRLNSDDALARYLPNQLVYKKFIHEQTLIAHFVDSDITDFFE
jgi:hypothetical protein